MVSRGDHRGPRVSRLGLLPVLKEIYLDNLKDGRASVRSVNAGLGTRSSAFAGIREAEASKLAVIHKGQVDLTPAGRRRLKVVMMGGAFEIIHPGHVQAVDEARRLGNTLVVVVATDESVERNKGRPPVTSQAARVGLVSSLRGVDVAVPGNKGSIYEILGKIRPDVVALGYDQRHGEEEIVREAAKRGIHLRVVRLGAEVPDLKTSKILMST